MRSTQFLLVQEFAMSMQSFQILVRSFGLHLGLPDLTTDEDGYVALTFDEQELHLQYEEDANRVMIFTRLGEVEVDRTAEIYGMLLEANLFWRGTRGATFSVDPDPGIVFLADRQAEDGMTAETLSAWLEGFLNTATYWKNRLDVANAGGSLLDPEIAAGLEGGAPTDSAPNPGVGIH
jgi:Tir chaperone protein (CesT) family